LFLAQRFLKERHGLDPTRLGARDVKESLADLKLRQSQEKESIEINLGMRR
jgi:DNA-directed RNA polymerase specialized sigma54-like protein